MFNKTRRQAFDDLFNDKVKDYIALVMGSIFEGKNDYEIGEVIEKLELELATLFNYRDKMKEVEEELANFGRKYAELYAQYENMQKQPKKAKYAVIVYEDDTSEQFTATEQEEVPEPDAQYDKELYVSLGQCDCAVCRGQ